VLVIVAPVSGGSKVICNNVMIHASAKKKKDYKPTKTMVFKGKGAAEECPPKKKASARRNGEMVSAMRKSWLYLIAIRYPSK
jgi:hypothetical protein